MIECRLCGNPTPEDAADHTCPACTERVDELACEKAAMRLVQSFGLSRVLGALGLLIAREGDRANLDGKTSGPQFEAQGKLCRIAALIREARNLL